MPPPPIPRWTIRLAVTAFQQMRKVFWFVARTRSYGVHAAPFTPEGKVVLVWLTYADGWRCPGGGRKADEPVAEAMLRELTEEIGLSAHGELRLLGDVEHSPDYRRDTSHLFLVTDVRYTPRWSLEIDRVAEFDPHDLPEETGTLTRHHVAMALAALAAPPLPGA
jgi:8-oxo-dGTP pyrophosphatase MutT (NUDIX family)